MCGNGKVFRSFILVFIVLVLMNTAGAEEITVCSSGCTNTTIKDAIDYASVSSSVDTITVSGGPYYENIVVKRSDLVIQASGDVIIDAGGAEIAVGIYADNVTFKGFTVINRLEGDNLPEPKDYSRLDLFDSIRNLYLEIDQIVYATDDYRKDNKTEKYIEIFGILSEGSAVQIIDNEVNVSSNITIILSPGDKMIDTYSTGIAVFDPIFDTPAISTTSTPTIVYDNKIIVNGERHINHTLNSALKDDPTTLSLGIFAESSLSEIINNTISVSGNSIIEGNLKHPRFLGEGFSLGIWTRYQGGIISENTINAENQFYMGTNNEKGICSAAWSIGIVPQESRNMEISDNNITVSANNEGVVINEKPSKKGIIYGIGIGIGTIWGNINTQIDGNNISAAGSVSLGVSGSTSEASVGTGAGIGLGILVPYEINENNDITRNTVAGTSLAVVDEDSDYSPVKLGAGVLVKEMTEHDPGENDLSNKVIFNNLVGSSDYGLYVFPDYGLEPYVDAKYNWWGACDGPGPSGSGDDVLGTLDFAPWLTSTPIDGHAFYGTVKYINGTNVSETEVITAWVDGVERGDITVVVAGEYGSEDVCGSYLVVQGDVEEGSEITFSFNGSYANEMAYFMYGAVTQFNLTESGDQVPDDDIGTDDPGTDSDPNKGKSGASIIKAGGSAGNAQPGGEGIMALPAAATPGPAAAGEEAPANGKSKSSWWWWLILLLLAIVLITYYQWNKAE